MEVQRRVDLLPPEPQGGEMPVIRAEANGFYDYVMALRDRVWGIIRQLTSKLDVQEQTVALQRERIDALEEREGLLNERIDVVERTQELGERELGVVRRRVAVMEENDALMQRQLEENAAERERLARRNAELEAANQANERRLRETQEALGRTTTLNALEGRLHQLKISQVATNVWANPLAILGGGAAFGIPFGPPGMIIGGIGAFVFSFFGSQLGYGRKKAQIQRQMDHVRRTH